MSLEGGSMMTRAALIKRFEEDWRQIRKNFKEGKCIPLEEFDWRLPFQIAESREEYRVENEAWTPIILDPDIFSQIQAIYHYISENLVNEPAAYHFKRTIENKFSTISTFPNGGTFILVLTDDISEEFSNLRRMSANNYIIIYEYYEEPDLVVIGHIFHQTQNYGKIFQK